MSARPTPTFADALAAIRSGAEYSLCGLTLTVNGVALAITSDEFDLAWDEMNERDAKRATASAVATEKSLPGSGRGTE